MRLSEYSEPRQTRYICQDEYMVRQIAVMESLFKALADETRLRILNILQPKASRHLAYLRRFGLVETRRSGLWIHYRLSQLDDPVLSAIVDAVRHGLTHVDVVRKDGERLQKRTGCCVPAPGDVAGTPCCAEPAAVAGSTR